MKKIIVVFMAIIAFLACGAGYGWAGPAKDSSKCKVSKKIVASESSKIAPRAVKSSPVKKVAAKDAVKSKNSAKTVAQEPSDKNVPPGLRERSSSDSSMDETSQENYRITAIEVRGNNNVPTEEIMEAVRSKVGDTLLTPRLKSDIQSLYDLGYFTDVKVDTPYYNSGVKIVIRVQENPVLTKITILGNKIVPTEKILELIQSREGKILNMKTLNGDINEINYYYSETLGYAYQPTHIQNVNWTPEGELILSIREGMPISEVKITGSTLFKEEKLRSLIKMKPGMLFNSSDVKADTNAISDFYEEEGYILDTIRPQVDYKDGVVTIQVLEAVVEDIKVEFENKKPKTKEYVVLRNIRTQKGKVLQRKKLQKDIERLNNLGYFSKVDVNPEPGSKPGLVNLVFKLKEEKTGLASIGVGYSGGGSGALRSGITGVLQYQERNLGGRGQAVSASWQRGVNIDSTSLAFTNPAINANQDSAGISLFRHRYTELRQPLYDSSGIATGNYALYDDKRYGGSLTYGRRITDDFRMFLSYRYESLDITRNAKSDYDPVGLSDGTMSAAGLGALYDTRNDVMDPVEGSMLDATYTYSGLGGTYKFNKYQAELRHYIRLGKKNPSTIALRAWGGMVRGASAPITEIFYVGGTDTIRGYVESEFYGSRMAVFNVEYRFPLGNIKFLKGTVFADAGNAWSPGSPRKKLYTDAGVGLRIVFPNLQLGVIRLDYSRSERGGRTSIGIGQTF